MTDTFGKTLKYYREAADVGLRELAKLVKKSPGYLSDVENEKVLPPSTAVILNLAGALQVDKRILLDAARKLDPDISDYVVENRAAADFLRKACERDFPDEYWNSLARDTFSDDDDDPGGNR